MIEPFAQRLRLKVESRIGLNRKRVPYERFFFGQKLYIHDHESFMSVYREIYREEVYKFTCTSREPYIIDCGANIGLATLYFKQCHPNSHIVAFEADPNIFKFLEKNVHSFGFRDVELINSAVFDVDDVELDFFTEGGAGGRVEKESLGGSSCIRVKTTRLKKLLVQDIAFLKIDIEGAESRVIRDCRDNLKLVQNLFIEYHSFSADQQELHEILEIVRDVGFRYHIKSAYVTRFPFVNRNLNAGMDNQLNISCYRE